MQQPVVNIGLLGHVANGKSSLVRCITGEKTSRNDSRCISKETDREMTIQVGYSNAKIYQCAVCPKPLCYASIEGSSTRVPECTNCQGTDMQLVQHVSFVDNPGHRSLIKNMISGSAVIDAAIVVIDTTQSIPQVQTEEHLSIAEIIGIPNYIAIAQNKVDLIIDQQEKSVTAKEEIVQFLQGTTAGVTLAPIIPTSFSPIRNFGVQHILQCIVERGQQVPRPMYDSFPIFIQCIRSFDINKAGCDFHNLKGGVLGGTIMHGTVKIGDTLEILPGIVTKDSHTPLYTRVVSLHTGKTPLQSATCGGLIGIGTTLDPSFTRSDRMVGMCAGVVGTLPEVTSSLDVKLYLLVDGVGKPAKLKERELLQLSVGSATVRAFVKEVLPKRQYTLQTEYPVCPVPGQSIPVSRVVNGVPKIIGKAIYRPSEQISNDVVANSKCQFDYDALLAEMTHEFEGAAAYEKLLLPPVKLGKEGGAKLVLTNFTSICKKLHRPPADVCNFITSELQLKSVSFNSREQLVIHGRSRYTQKQLQSVLLDYIQKYVLCAVCKCPHTTQTPGRTNKYVYVVCNKCGSEATKST